MAWHFKGVCSGYNCDSVSTCIDWELRFRIIRRGRFYRECHECYSYWFFTDDYYRYFDLEKTSLLGLKSLWEIAGPE